MQISAMFPFLVEAAIKTTVVLAAASVIVRVIRGRSAALKHLIWTSAFVGVLALPVLTVALPELSLPIASSPMAKQLIFRTDSRDAAVETQGGRRAGFSTQAAAREVDWRAWMVVVWGLGALYSFSQMLFGWAAMERLKRKARPWTMDNDTTLAAPPNTQLIEAAAGCMPMTYGVFRPVIFIPSDARSWDGERLRMVLLHEFAHVRRNDAGNQLLARTALALCWWNPMAWHAWREFLKEREKAADDLVLSSGANGTHYAGHLLEIARSFQEPSTAAWATVPMASKTQLEARLISILDTKLDRTLPPRATASVSLLLAILMVAPLAALQARPGQTDSATASAQLPAAVRSLLQAGDRAVQAGKFDEAKLQYTKALGLQPNLPVALLDRGYAEMALKDYPAASDDFQQAGKADSAYATQSLMWQAVAQEKQNNLESASDLYQRAVAAGDPHSISTVVAMELYSDLLHEQGLSDQAAAMQKQASAAREELARTLEQPANPKALHVGGDVKPPVLVTKFEPEYSQIARIAKYQGTAVLKVEIGADGKTHNVQVVRPLGLGLDEKAVEAVNQWLFQPGTRDGQPVDVAATIEVKFQLK